MGRVRRRKSPGDPTAGDIVVTKVATLYHIGRVQAVGQPVTTIDVRNDRNQALALACRAVTGHQRVFLYGQAGTMDREEIDCANLAGES